MCYYQGKTETQVVTKISCLLNKISDHCVLLLNQLLVNSHWEINLISTSKKKNTKAKNLALFVGYVGCAHREICAKSTFQLLQLPDLEIELSKYQWIFLQSW